MRNLAISIGFFFFTILLFVVGALISSGLMMGSVICLLLPLALWLNGFFFARAGIRLKIESDEAISINTGNKAIKRAINQSGDYT